MPRDRIKLPSPDYKTGIIVIIITGQYLVVDVGFEPTRCSPSDRSPEFINLSRSPKLSTICGGKGRIWTDGFRDLQSLALGRSATLPYLVLLTGNDPMFPPYQGGVIPLYYRSDFLCCLLCVKHFFQTICCITGSKCTWLDKRHNITHASNVAHSFVDHTRTAVHFIWVDVQVYFNQAIF